MATRKTITNNIRNQSVNYVGEITYLDNLNSFISGDSFDLKPIYVNPISYSIARDTFFIVTENKYYDNVFDKVRNKKTGSGRSEIEFDALASNDFNDIQSLSAVSEDETDAYIIGISDILSSNNITDLSVYSLNTTVNFSVLNQYWKYSDGILSSTDKPDVFDESYFFYFKFIDGNFCNIIKSLSGGIEYLTYDSNNFIFQSNYDENNSKFLYSYNTETNQIILINNSLFLGYSVDGELSAVSINSVIDETTNVFNLNNKNSLNLEESVVNSFLPIYTNKNTIGQSFSVDNNAIISHNYNSYLDKNSNYITLKNNVIYDEKYSLINTGQNSSFRNYTSINTGIRGDSGYNNVILSYNTQWYKYDFTPDKQTYFNIPFEMYGHEQININDCKLLENGATGGNSPLNSDKLYKKHYEYLDFKNTGITAGVDNAKYLCSWLYFNPLYPSRSVWLDRYYIPDKVTQLDALSVDGWNTIKELQSFSEKHPFNNQYETYYNEFLREVGVIDIESKLTIQPNSLYLYEKIGPKTSEKLFEELSSYKLDSVSNEYLDHSNSFYLLTDSTSNDEEFTMNIVLKNFDLDVFEGNKIFGNRTISLTVDKDFSPYNLTVDGDTIHYYDIDYNYIKSINLSSNIDDIIFTDDYNKFYVDCEDNNFYTIESLDFITNSTNLLSSLNVEYITFDSNNLYVLDSIGDVYIFNPDLDTLNYKNSVPSGHDLLVVKNGDIYSSMGSSIDYSDSNEIYTLSLGSNEIFYKDIATPIISSSDAILDFYVDKTDVIFILKGDSILKVNNQTLAELDINIPLSPTYGFTSLNVNRYQRNGVVYEYIDIIDKNGTDCIIHRYDKELNFIETIEKVVSGAFIKSKSRANTKFLNKELSIKFTLFDIFNYYKKDEVILTIDQKRIDESDMSIINISFSNKFGTISTYFNGNLIDIYKFDTKKFYFSNTLRDNKIFFGASNITDEILITDLLSSANNDMISGNCQITEASIYDKAFNYFDVINYNRIFNSIPDSHLIIPVKPRAYLEEIAGFYNQNKNIRKSEFGSINIVGTELTETMKTDIKNKSVQLFEDIFINLKVNELEFK